MTADLLEELFNSPPEHQEAYLRTLRSLEKAKAQQEVRETEFKQSMEQRWLTVPRWRRAIILAADWVAQKFSPAWLRGQTD